MPGGHHPSGTVQRSSEVINGVRLSSRSGLIPINGSKFAPYLIAQNYLVVGMQEWAALTGEEIEFRG
jgi:hypothetical protein